MSNIGQSCMTSIYHQAVLELFVQSESKNKIIKGNNKQKPGWHKKSKQAYGNGDERKC